MSQRSPRPPTGRTALRAQPAEPAIRLLLVDDHPVVREGLRSWLGAHPQLQVIGEAASGEEALRQARRLRPDLVLLDINLPGLIGLETAARLRRVAPAARVIILTVHAGREYLAQVPRSGARGYVLKDASPAELVRAIAAGHRGATFFSPQIAATMLNRLTPADAEPLSERERAVLAAIAEGASSKEIGRRFAITYPTGKSIGGSRRG